MHIIEYIGAEGVKTTSTGRRLFTPRPGDIIEFPDGAPYPYNTSKYGRIADIGGPWNAGDEGKAHICCELGSAFLRPDGSVSISGGPFASVDIEDLEPTATLYVAMFWNWGDNSSGAGQGVNYLIARPLFRLDVEVEREVTEGENAISFELGEGLVGPLLVVPKS